jgi:energy-coupling factor transporter ATP-binding protein EcfA2
MEISRQQGKYPVSPEESKAKCRILVCGEKGLGKSAVLRHASELMPHPLPAGFIFVEYNASSPVDLQLSVLMQSNHRKTPTVIWLFVNPETDVRDPTWADREIVFKIPTILVMNKRPNLSNHYQAAFEYWTEEVKKQESLFGFPTVQKFRCRTESEIFVNQDKHFRSIAN